MKTIARILGVTVLVALTVSCNKLVDYEFEPFAVLGASSYSVSEDGGTLTIPVTLYNSSDREVTLTVTTSPDASAPANEGTDYTISDPASGVLTFAAGETEKNITVSVVNHADVYTGNLRFNLSVASSTAGVTMGNLNSCRVTISDNDKPFSWFSTWVASVPSYFGGSYNMAMTITDEGDNNVTITGLCPYFVSLGYTPYEAEGVISDDGETLTIANAQATGYSYGGVSIDYVGLDASNLDDAVAYADIVIQKNSDGKTITIPNAWGTTNGEYWWGAYNAPVTLEAE